MTESTWLSCTDSGRMLDWLLLSKNAANAAPGLIPRGILASDHKLRLFSDACRNSFYHGYLVRTGTWSGWESYGHMQSCLRDQEIGAEAAARAWASELSVGERPKRVDFLRDIIGNPFFPLAFIGEYLNDSSIQDTIVATAKARGQKNGMSQLIPDNVLVPDVIRLTSYAINSEDFSSLPILADALEEAGACGRQCWSCQGYGNHLGSGPDRDNPECGECHGTGELPNPLLVHLRSSSLHVRGCWVLDLLDKRSLS